MNDNNLTDSNVCIQDIDEPLIDYQYDNMRGCRTLFWLLAISLGALFVFGIVFVINKLA